MFFSFFLSKIFKNVLEVCYAQQDYIYLMKNAAKP